MSAKMKIAIVWESIPEDTDIYIVEVTADEWEWMKKTHLLFVNAGNEAPECMRLSLWLDEKKKDRKPVQSTNDSWQKKNKGKADPVDMEGISHLLVTGFMM